MTIKSYIDYNICKNDYGVDYMAIHKREQDYIRLLAERDHTVSELAAKLFISEPTVRRDIIDLKEKDLLICKRGLVSLKKNSPDKRIPRFIRDLEHNEEKKEIAIKAASLIKDGYVVMLDSSTTIDYLLPHLTQFKNLFVITNGAQAAIALASMGIHTLCTGGEMTLDTFSYVGTEAERTLTNYNADIAFVSCRGISDEGLITDASILENTIRKIMIKNSKQSYFLCDKSKFGKTYLNTICHVKDVDGVISN